MLFTEPAFLFLFLPIVLAVYSVLRGHESRNVWLLLASIAFYATGGGQFLAPMLASIVLNYLFAVAVARAQATSPRLASAVLIATVGANLAVLAWFKYASFLVGNANGIAHLFGAPGWAVPDVALPIGISFFTFHAISYVVDVYRGAAIAQKNPVHAALYLLLFPQLIAGPIIRYREIADQLAARLVTMSGLAWGVRRFTVGLGKKILIANVVAGPADRIFALPLEQLEPGLAWLGLVCYTLQIYFDFSGYSDMAIGIAAMFGFRFPENFNHPYIARTVQEFWRRWHLSLSNWFRDYLYIPLGGNRVGPARVYGNLLVVFFLCGLWHGASWNFVVWGLIHGAFLVVERAGFASWMARRPRAIGHAYALAVAMFAWVFFRAETLPQALGYLRALAGGGSGRAPYTVGFFADRLVVVAIVAGIIGAGPWMAAAGRAALARSADGDRTGMALRVAAVASIALLLASSALFIAANAYSPFIYFRF
ncbi:MAG: MBOAT family protein [Acidobacteria bacterium]|nr:MBOAT family protein [Acidobacteriota bacterium]